MSIDNVIFIDSFPKLDLHGYDRETARVAIDDFINDHVKLKNKIIVIVHGIGTGILRQATKQTLKTNKNVDKYKTYYHNDGCTIVSLKYQEM